MFSGIREFLPDRSWDLRGILHPADNRPLILVLTAIAVPTRVGLLVFAGVLLDTTWDATPALLPPAIGPICVAASFWLTLTAQWGSFFSIRQRETCQASEPPPPEQPCESFSRQTPYFAFLWVRSRVFHTVLRCFRPVTKSAAM